MKSCWEILGIEQTLNLDAIRQAYLALLPSFHPESDPQGFQQLRQAYEQAQRAAKMPDESPDNINNDDKGESESEHDILTAFKALLASDSERFQPSCWQRFIQQLNLCSVDEVDKLRWPLCAIAMDAPAGSISLSCLSLLAGRLGWQPLETSEDVDVEMLEGFLDAIKRGDVFDFQCVAKWPVAVQEQTILYFFELERLWHFHPEYLMDALQMQGTWLIPDYAPLQRKLLRWYSSLHWGIAEWVDVARQWRKAEPDSEDAYYYFCAQRVFCGEGESLLPELCDFWQQYPSTQADELLLRWSREHRPDFFPLLVMVIEARCLVDTNGDAMKYIPGESARTRLLWAEILQSGRLSPLGQSFVESLFYKRKAMSWSSTRLKEKGEPETPLLDLYRTAEQVVLEAFPKQKAFYRLLLRLDSGDGCPLEALITQTLLTRIPLKPGDIREKEELAEELKEAETAPPKVKESSNRAPTGKAMKIMKIIAFIALIVCAFNRFFHFF